MLQKDEERLGFDTGTDESILDKRLKSMVKEEVKYAKEYGDDYFKKGTGLFGRLGRSLGDSGEGLRVFTDMRKANNQLGDMYTNEELASMINKGYSDAGLEYKFVLPEKFKSDRVNKAHGGGDLPNKGLEALHKEEPELVGRMIAQEGGPMSMDDQMKAALVIPVESEMESDDDMEDNYTKFIMEEALTEEEEDMLMSKLEQDEELAMLFDKVIDVAQEFAGSGPVEGPGSGVSDSIPARLSDGEFVFTAKAVEEIGADNLMAMMKDAEAKADKRQPLQTGGAIGEEETMATKTPMTEQVIRVERDPEVTGQVGVGGSILDQVREEDNPLYEEMPFKRPPVHGAGYGR